MIDFEKAKELMKKAVDESTVSQEIMERFIEAVYSRGYEDGMISIQSEQRAGKWIEHERAEEVDGFLISNYECSYCHSWERKKSYYCPDCGAKMEEERYG